MGKLHHALQTFTSDESVRNMCSLFGLIFHLTPIVRAPTDQYYHVLKYYRRKCASLQRDEVTTPRCGRVSANYSTPGSSFTDTTGQSHALPRCSPMSTFLPTPATLVGGGYLIDADGQVQIVAGAWTARDRSRSINEREAMAVFNTLTKFLPQLQKGHFNLHIDNTSVCWGLVKGRSPIYNMNARIAEVSNLMLGTGTSFVICYVASADNYADHSRTYTNRSTKTQYQEVSMPN